MRRLRRTPLRLAALLGATLALGLGSAYAASMSVSTTKLWGGTQALTKSTCALSGTTQTTDTYVNQASPNSSYGTATSFSVQPNSASNQRVGFVRFNLTSCAIPTTGGADTATLSLYISTAPSSNRTISLYPVLSTWGNTLTWNQALLLSYGTTPTTSFTTGTTSGVTKTVTVTVDVDGLIKTPGSMYGWALEDTTGAGSGTTTFASSENGTSSRRPKLTINYEK